MEGITLNMIVTARGLKAWLWILGIILVVIVGLIIVFHILMILLPIVIVLLIIGYLFKMLNKVKKGEPKDNKKKEYIDVEHKLKK